MIERFIDLVLAGTVRDRQLRDAIAGDLIEEHSAIAGAHGRTAAAAWLARQMIGSLPRLSALSSDADHACTGVSLTLALAFYGALGALTALATILVILIDHAGASARLWPALPVSLVASVACAVAAGFLSAALVRRAPLIGACALGALCMAMGVGALALNEVHVPLWYWSAMQFAFLPATAAGGLLRIRRQLHRII